jgi:hypothetical protein
LIAERVVAGSSAHLAQHLHSNGQGRRCLSRHSINEDQSTKRISRGDSDDLDPTPQYDDVRHAWALAIQILCLPSASAQSSQVTVVNGATEPVPVSGTVNVNPAPQANNPYQVTQSIGDSSTCAPQCMLNFTAVPAGSRLVVTYVSAQLGAGQEVLVMEGNGSAFFIPKAYPTANYLAAPVTVYFEAGSTPTARFFVPNAAQRTSLIVTLVGYLVPVQ